MIPSNNPLFKASNITDTLQNKICALDVWQKIKIVGIAASRVTNKT
jgi:hypothetical protein